LQGLNHIEARAIESSQAIVSYASYFDSAILSLMKDRQVASNLRESIIRLKESINEEKLKYLETENNF